MESGGPVKRSPHPVISRALYTSYDDNEQEGHLEHYMETFFLYFRVGGVMCYQYYVMISFKHCDWINVAIL